MGNHGNSDRLLRIVEFTAGSVHEAANFLGVKHIFGDVAFQIAFRKE
jgi:hypothetical protein